MVHTYLGYKKGYDVHHLDENPWNNSFSNLVYLTHIEHQKLHKGKNRGKSFHKSNKQCLKQIKALEEKLANIKMIKNYEEQIKMLQLKIENNKVAKRLRAQIEELKKCLQ